MLPQEVIRKKRFGHPLSADDIEGFFGGFMRGEVADYQVAAMLMAIVLKGMDRQEATALTLTMRDSGRKLHWGGDQSQIVDKHSTGGVGDKTSLVILPLCVLEGLRVPMIAGRGLGHTGGTLDKLEAISGTNVFMTAEESARLLRDHGGFFMGQTEEIAPLDKKLYAMRDVTDTVESVPLITASILSKKLAEGIGCLVMDVKYGSGAFMRAKSDAMALAESIAAVGSAAGLKIRCALTDMGSPLGDRAGNSLEVIECVEILQGQGPSSTRDLSVDLAVEMAHLARPSIARADVRERMLGHLSSGRAFEVFAQIIKSQGGDISFIEDVTKFKQAPVIWDVKAESNGVIVDCDVRELGLAIVELGGGRRRSTDTIDPAVGLSELKRVGDKIGRGDIIARIHANSKESALQVATQITTAYKIGPKVDVEPLIWRMI
jgi:thymidine phosphorylase